MTSRIDPAQIPSSPDLFFETSLWQVGVQAVAGIDEAGRGAWAGPVAAGVVILPQNNELTRQLAGVRDSKQLSPSQRALLAPVIQQSALAWAVGFSEANEIDLYGILFCTRLAMQRAVSALKHNPNHLLIDALFLPEIPIPQTSLLKGDQRSLSIAAASILAKTARDALMVRLDDQIPGYDFASHKGYGTAAHQQALARLGASSQHRHSYAPLRELALQNTPS